MPNNIQAINEELERRRQEDEEEAAKMYDANIELTEEEEKRFAEIAQEQETVVHEVSPDGTTTTIPLKEYAASLDQKVKNITDEDGNIVAKGVNTGDIRETTEDLKEAARKQAIQTFRQMSLDHVDTDRYSDDDIIKINDDAIEAIRTTMGVERLDSNEIRKFYRKMTLSEIVATLPKSFTGVYTKESEIKANNIFAKNRLIATLEFLSTTGPELDYLNEYIDTESRLMKVSQRILECQMDFSKMLESKEKLSEFVARAEELSPAPKEEIWKKYTNPKLLHNEFAQRRVMHELLIDSYRMLNLQYQDDDRATEMITEQIMESRSKMEVYEGITKLERMRHLFGILDQRYRTDKKGSYANLEREAMNALDRIRRAKQNVHFPVYDPRMANNLKEMYRLYMRQYPQILEKYNDTIKGVLIQDPSVEVGLIEIPDVDSKLIYEYFSMLLLVLFGRIMKALSGHDATKYDAIELDAYFICYCKLTGDAYMMTDVWELCQDLVRYMVKNWPKPKGRKS